MAEVERIVTEQGAVDATGYQDTDIVVDDRSSNVWLLKVGPYDVLKWDKFTEAPSPIDFVSFGEDEANARPFYPNKYLLHTTEAVWPKFPNMDTSTLDQKFYWPHLMVGRNATGHVNIAQFSPLNMGARALGKKHNDALMVQVENCAWAKWPFTSWDAEVTRANRWIYKALRLIFKMPNCVDARIEFKDLKDKAYGKDAPQRIKVQEDWRILRGLVGHQHAPNELHWDPGAINPLLLLWTNDPVDTCDASTSVAAGAGEIDPPDAQVAQNEPIPDPEGPSTDGPI